MSGGKYPDEGLLTLLELICIVIFTTWKLKFIAVIVISKSIFIFILWTCYPFFVWNEDKISLSFITNVIISRIMRSLIKRHMYTYVEPTREWFMYSMQSWSGIYLSIISMPLLGDRLGFMNSISMYAPSVGTLQRIAILPPASVSMLVSYRSEWNFDASWFVAV